MLLLQVGFEWAVIDKETAEVLDTVAFELFKEIVVFLFTVNREFTARKEFTTNIEFIASKEFTKSNVFSPSNTI